MYSTVENDLLISRISVERSVTYFESMKKLITERAFQELLGELKNGKKWDKLFNFQQNVFKRFFLFPSKFKKDGERVPFDKKF